MRCSLDYAELANMELPGWRGRRDALCFYVLAAGMREKQCTAMRRASMEDSFYLVNAIGVHSAVQGMSPRLGTYSG